MLPFHIEREKEEPADVEVFCMPQVDALPATAQLLGQATSFEFDTTQTQNGQRM